MRVYSMFDGISAGRLALERAGIPVTRYFASEIDPYAIKISQHNYPDIVQLGDVTEVSGSDMGNIDLLIGGSPCQAFSNAGNKLGFDDPRGKLFFEYMRLLKELQPRYFLLENVKMKPEHEAVINEHLGMKPREINSSLVSAQNRKRLYWTNIPFKGDLTDRGIKLRDVLLSDVNEPMLSNIYGGFGEKKPRVHFDKSVTIRTASGGGHIPSLIHSQKAIDYMNRKTRDGRTHWDFKHHSDSSNDKSSCVTANLYKGIPYNVLVDNGCIRKLDPVEVERLQTFPDNYTACVSNTRRYHGLGNSWTVDVIVELFKGLA